MSIEQHRQHLEETGGAFHLAQERVETVRQSLGVAIRDAVGAGLSESEIARAAGVTRMTVRKALGK
jgi:DNA-binding GntR family transcriptional regulator